jgi:hypothetical protein
MSNVHDNQNFIDLLELEFPPSKLVDERLGIYAWRLDDSATSKVFAIAAKKPDATQVADDYLITDNDLAPDNMALVNEVLALSLGDSHGPCCDTERGRRFISRMPIARRLEWANVVFDHCEIYGPNEERKKK